MIEAMVEPMMLRLLDHSKAAKPCNWLSPVLKYRRVGHDVYQLECDVWCESGIKGFACELRHKNGKLMSRRTQEGRIEIFAGYVWDGPSGRFPFIPELQTYDTRDSMLASLIHDDGYRGGREHKSPLELRHNLDALFLKILIQQGMYHWRAERWYWAVCTFGEFAYTGAQEAVTVVP
jgi:hypothetical protein